MNQNLEKAITILSQSVLFMTQDEEGHQRQGVLGGGQRHHVPLRGCQTALSEGHRRRGQDQRRGEFGICTQYGLCATTHTVILGQKDNPHSDLRTFLGF